MASQRPRTRDFVLPRASDGLLALLISLSTLAFLLRFVPPYAGQPGLPGGSGPLLAVVAPLLLCAVLVERMVDFAARRSGPPLLGLSRERLPFVFAGLAALGLSIAGFHLIDSITAPADSGSLALGRRVLVGWTELAVTTGLIAGAADAVHLLFVAAGARTGRSDAS